MADERRHSDPAAAGPAPGASPLDYAAPGADARSQWITDAHPGGAWLVGCLMVLCAVAAVLGGLAWLLSGMFSGMWI